jgi:stalled ribosome rescue protein Dom34
MKNDGIKKGTRGKIHDPAASKETHQFLLKLRKAIETGDAVRADTLMRQMSKDILDKQAHINMLSLTLKSTHDAKATVIKNLE